MMPEDLETDIKSTIVQMFPDIPTHDITELTDQATKTLEIMINIGGSNPIRTMTIAKVIQEMLQNKFKEIIKGE